MWYDWAAFLGSMPLFQGLSRRHLQRVARLAEARWYGDGRTIVRAGSAGDSFFAIVDGRVQLETPSGHRRVLEPGASFGELGLVDGAPRSATVVSLGGVKTARIPRRAFLKLLREEPVIAHGVVRSLVATIRDIQAEIDEKGSDIGRLNAPDPLFQEEFGEEGKLPVERVIPVLASMPLFQGLSKRHLRRIVRIAELRRYAHGSTIVREGARGTSFHVVIEGQAEVTSRRGVSVLLMSGGYFGELSLIDGAPRAASVIPDGRMTTLRIGRPEFLRLLKEEPSINLGLVDGLVAVVRNLQRSR
jgi:CRP-like cAMP-binding protein